MISLYFIPGNFSVFHDFSVFLKFIAEIRSYLAVREKFWVKAF